MSDLAEELERTADRLDPETAVPLRELASAVRANPRLAEVVETCATAAWARRVLAEEPAVADRG